MRSTNARGRSRSVTRDDLVAAADALRRELGVRHPLALDLELVLHDRGALVGEGEVRGARACLTRVGARAVVTVAKALPREERRFSLGHELGHCVLHPRASSHHLCFGGALDDPSAHEGLEREANEFAAEWLMPAALVAPRVRASASPVELARALADELEVSLPAVLLRVVELSDRPLAVVFSKAGAQGWSKRSPTFTRWIKKRKDGALHPASLASRCFAEGVDVDEPQRVRAEAWLGRAEPSEEIFEHAVVSREHASVLSVLSM